MKKQLSKLKLPKRHFSLEVSERMVIDLYENGQKTPILVKGNTVIDGVARCLAAIELGWEEIEVQI